MSEIKKMFKKLLKKMGQPQNDTGKRKIDTAIEKTTESLGSQFSLISKQKIAAWKAYLIIFFVAGFFASIIWGAYNRWYIESKAGTVILSVVTDTDARKAGDQYVDHFYLDTGGQNVVAVQAIAAYDKTKVQIVSLDDSTSDFPNEVLKNNDTANSRIFVALGKQTPGVNSAQAKVVDVTVKVLADFTGSALIPTFASAAAVNDSAAILDDGKGTNVLTQVINVVTNPTPPPPADTTPPIISGGSPSGTLAAGTTTATLRVLTNENATCKYGTAAGTAYDAISSTFTTTGGTNHTTSLTGLADGTSYNYYVRCKDAAGNPDTSDYRITFSIAQASSGGGGSGGSGPTITKSSPSGTLASGTASATLKVATNVAATCKYSTTTGTAYDSMPNTFSTTGGTTSSTKVSGLTNGTTYNYYVRCKDASGNVDTSDYTITFSVVSAAASGDKTPPTMSNSSPSGSIPSTTSTQISLQTSEPATCKYDTKSKAYNGMANTFSTTGGTAHSSSVNVASGASYAFYARCKDTAGNITSGFLLIKFSVQ